MIELSDSRWGELKHAYGFAADIPELLQQLSLFPLYENYRSEPYFSLWGALCHQGNVFTASYAAVPHMVLAIERSPRDAPLSLFLLPCQVEIQRILGMGPEVPKYLADSYTDSLKRLHRSASLVIEADLDYEASNVMCAVIAISTGHSGLARAILKMDEDLISDFIEWSQHQ